MRYLIGAFVITVSAAVLGCMPETVDIDVEQASLAEAVEAYNASMSSLHPQAAASLYGNDVFVIPKGKETFSGRQGAEDYLIAAAGNPGFQAEFETLAVHVSPSGASGYSVALVTVTIDGPDGEPVCDITRDVHFWEKNATGEWQIVLDTWNTAPANMD